MYESKGQAGGVLTPVAGMSPELNEVLEFLYGVGQMDSVWWGEGPPDDKPRYWWRSKLRNAIKAAFTRPTPAAAAGVPTVLNALDVLARMGLAQDTAPAARFLQIMGERDLFVIDMRGASPVAPAGAPAEEKSANVADLDAVIARWQGLHDNADWFSDDPDKDRSEFAVTLKHLRAYRALLSAGSQGEQHDSSHEAAPQSSVPSASPLSSLPETDESALPREPK